ncbi:flagellar basal body rod protein FlgB [Lentisphaerota bacterium WC36G]|nr:flagellar basal body rod protein FlgB [Lentisphaerae bacterium WC36]
MELDSLVFDNTAIINSQMMQMAQERQKLIANNIANAETPNYIRQESDFRMQLANAVANNDIAKVQNLKSNNFEDTKVEPKKDGNNIILPNEMNEMMQNSIFYNLANKAFKTRMNIIKSAIKG